MCHTNNGGKTWMVDSNRDSLALAINSIYFVDSLIGFEGSRKSLNVSELLTGGKKLEARVQDRRTRDIGDYDVYQIKFCISKTWH